jgi:hypothetical protein
LIEGLILIIQIGMTQASAQKRVFFLGSSKNGATQSACCLSVFPLVTFKKASVSPGRSFWQPLHLTIPLFGPFE